MIASSVKLIDSTNNNCPNSENLQKTTNISPQKKCLCSQICEQTCINGWYPLFNATCECLMGSYLDPNNYGKCLPCFPNETSGSIAPNHRNVPWSTILAVLNATETWVNMCGGSDCVVGERERYLPGIPQCWSKPENCSYPCTRQTSAVRNLTAQGLLKYLIGQLHQDNFITKVYQERFHLNETQINIPDEVGLWQNGAWSSFVDYYYVRIEIERECSIMRKDPTLMALLCNFQSLDIDCRGEKYYQDQYKLMSTSRSFINYITLDLVYISHQNYCEIGVIFSEWRLVSVVLVILLIIISSISLILFIIFSIFAIAYLSTNIRLLPQEIRWSFLDKLCPWKWSYLAGPTQSGYYYKLYERKSIEWNRVVKLFDENLSGDFIEIESIKAIYNPTLTSAFINAWKIITDRLTNSPDLFKVEIKDFENERNWVLSQYQSRVSRCNWNESLLAPIIPACHGTGLHVAEKIAETGFAALSIEDDGYYGKGIYFTSYALYTITYCSKQKHPSIIISWVSLGNVYPIIENPNEEDSVLGKAIKQNSHYVITNNEGFPLLRDDPSVYNYDEIVVAQEAQILPAFILSIKKENMNKLLSYFKYSNFPGGKKKLDTYKVRLSSVRLSSSSSSSQDNMIEFSSVLDNDNETEALLSDNDLSNPLKTMNINRPYYPPRISKGNKKERHKRI